MQRLAEGGRWDPALNLRVGCPMRARHRGRTAISSPVVLQPAPAKTCGGRELGIFFAGFGSSGGFLIRCMIISLTRLSQADHQEQFALLSSTGWFDIQTFDFVSAQSSILPAFSAQLSGPLL